MHIVHRPAVEARAWLRGNPNRSAFATSRFGATEWALAFVESLYACGADTVLVDDPGVDSEGTPYADTLLVMCPEYSDARFRLEQFCEEHGPGEVRDVFRMDAFSDHLRLWWD